MQYFNVEEILRHYDIYYEAKISSNDLDILCPFHDDKNIGSAKINTETGLFNCYSCKTGGNIFQFVAMLEGVSITEAGILIENDFELVKTYDIEKLKVKLGNIRINDEDSTYRKLAQKLSLKLLFEISKYNLPQAFIHRWNVVNSWILDVPLENTGFKYKQILQIYSLFIKEKEYYEMQNLSAHS